MMTDEEFGAFVETSLDALDAKQQKYGLGSFQSFFFDQPTGTLQFKEGEQVVISARVTLIGSFSTNGAGSWQWAWANPATQGESLARCEKLKALDERTGIKLFTLPLFEADEQMANELTAMFVEHLGALGFYRMPTSGGKLYVFVAIDSVTRPAA